MKDMQYHGLIDLLIEGTTGGVTQLFAFLLIELITKIQLSIKSDLSTHTRFKNMVRKAELEGMVS